VLKVGSFKARLRGLFHFFEGITLQRNRLGLFLD
jgi:hypothetical protein